MDIGRSSGCHQMAERSFSINGLQFPICARCTGVLIGNIIALAMFFFYTLPTVYCIIGCAVMFLDWLIQYVGIRKSTNIRRLTTGIIGGYTLTTIYCKVMIFIINYFI
jgi:uncharacterized membrane protein